MPFYPENSSEEGQLYEIETFWDKTVADYMGISMPDVQELDMVNFLAIRRDAFISEMSKTQEGREYLTNAWYYEQTDADYEGLREIQREMMGGGTARGQ